MVTKEFLREKLQCSELYAQKLIDSAQGDENKLYDLIYPKTCRTPQTPCYRRILNLINYKLAT
ncbi:Uncharacterised protein [Staphylococcus aureus]|nr:Uncharacterised protein [Staphylococcus aureus]SUK10021.1 Uncharacterised protein [Staphylococcus aureus]